MRKDLILNDSQKQQRRAKIQENRLRRLGLPVPSTSDSEQTSLSAESAEQSPVGKDASPASIVKREPSPKTHVIAADVHKEDLSGLSEKSLTYVENMMKAFSISFDSGLDSLQQPQIPHPTNNVDFLNMAESSVRRLVKMAKYLVPFKELTQDDQISLLKGAVLEVLILRSIKMFDSEAMMWKMQRGGNQQTVSAAALQCTNTASAAFFTQYQHFAARLNTSIKCDNLILMLLIVMAVVSPDRPSITDKELVGKIQETYANILQEYIQLKYPEEPGMFAKVLQQLAEIRELDESHMRLMMQVKVDDLQPLIKEIFDLLS